MGAYREGKKGSNDTRGHCYYFSVDFEKWNKLSSGGKILFNLLLLFIASCSSAL